MGNESTDRYDSLNGDLLRQGSGAWIAAVPGRMKTIFTGPKATRTQGAIRILMYPSDIRSASRVDDTKARAGLGLSFAPRCRARESIPV
ncbi:hypothetical protein C27AD_17216 [Salinisphaera hydrothermalis C27AD]